ncbi:hypothetical protein GQX73_g5774 [Xylaria multiplex]|uniref:Uncharacterized protein n=1 Tax=Xylaria multiplex TaxID=323545 RepID=A0A7C8N6J9_9PEZI|nr:hypothetical protein GQX73_g5774 [Xylaria multiplex]
MFKPKLAPYPNPGASLGREIPCNKIRRRKVWVAIGPARDAFEQEIVPEIKMRLQKIDLGHADLFIKLYMVGKKPESANPILMLCCVNANAAKEAEATVRESAVLEKYEGFGLGITDLPLEHPGPVRHLFYQEFPPSPGPARPRPVRPLPTPPTPPPLPPPVLPPLDIPLSLRIVDFDSLETLGSSDGQACSTAVFALSSEPWMGRRIFTADGGLGPTRFATAGIILDVGGDFYQLTVGHLFEPEHDVSDAGFLPMSPGYCCFDGQSDDEESDSDEDAESRGSDGVNSKDTQSHNQIFPDATSEWTSGRTGDDMFRLLSPSSTSRHTSRNLEIHMRSYDISDRIPIGYCKRTLRRFPIDYAIIALRDASVEAMSTRLNLIPGQDNLYATGIGGASNESRNIIVVTSSGVIHGELLLGTVAYRSHDSFCFQELVQVNLEEAVFEGDCGSPVLDRVSGRFYGHVIMGAPEV